MTALTPDSTYAAPADEFAIAAAAAALAARGYDVRRVPDRTAARDAALGLLPVVPDLNTAMRRIRHYSLPLEDARAREAYGMGSAVHKVLTLHGDFEQGRIHVLLIDEPLGY